MHGSIKTDFGLQTENNMFSGHSLSGNIGSGESAISINTVNGSIKVMTK